MRRRAQLLTPILQVTNNVPVAYIAGIAVAGVAAIAAVAAASFVALRFVLHRQAHRVFVRCCRAAKAGDVGSRQLLPPNLRSYTAERVLGRGTTAIVLQARKKGATRAVALKIVVPATNGDCPTFSPAEVRLVRRELAALELVTAAQIEGAVQLAGLEAHVEAAAAWFAMDLVEGETLASILVSPAGGPLSCTECIHAGRSVLAALRALHAGGAVHGDVCPANIMKVREALAGPAASARMCAYKLIDFGCAMGIDMAVAPPALMPDPEDEPTGDPAFRAPEWFQQVCEIGAARICCHAREQLLFPSNRLL